MLAETLATFLIGNQMDETSINAKFAALIEQRNNALNAYVNLVGDCAALEKRVKELEKKLAEITAVQE